MAVKRVMSAVSGFLNPWAVEDKEHIYVLSSGAPVSKEVEDDVLKAGDIGRNKKEEFMLERITQLAEVTVGFFDKIPKLKLKTMSHSNKIVKLTSAKGKIIQYQEQSDVFCAVLVKSQLLPKPISIEELMTYPLTPIPHSLGTPHGFMCKTDKAKLMHHLVDSVEDAELPDAVNDTIFIEDGNAVIHALKSLPSTFKQTVYKIVDNLKKKKNVVFSTDSYLQSSVKTQERLQRGEVRRCLSTRTQRCQRVSLTFLEILKIRHSSSSSCWMSCLQKNQKTR